MGRVVYLHLTRFWQAGGGSNGRRVTGSGRVGAQQVVEGGRCEYGWDHCSVISGYLLFLNLGSSGFQDLRRLKPPSLLMILGCISISMASLMRRSMWPVLGERSTVTPGNYPKENKLHLEQGESLKSRNKNNANAKFVYKILCWN